ncbi:MAG: Yip1 family protein [Xanthobacteraceae bacterium]
MTIVERIKAILLRPEAEWRTIAEEPGDPSDLFTFYVAILALIPALAWLIGGSVVGITTADGTIRTPLIPGLFSAIFAYVASFVAVGLMALAIDGLARAFGGRRDFANAVKLAAYSYTPLWLAGIFDVLPGLRFLSILGLYGLYLLWTGLPPLMQVTRKRGWCVLVLAVCAVALTLLIGELQGAIFSRRIG